MGRRHSKGQMVLSKPPYGNFAVFNSDGKMMFRCDEKRMNWYLSRGLAKPITHNTIELLFQPKGPGHVGDVFFLHEKHNDCVVCGATKDLTKHHVVPRGYRKFFPEELKSHASHDVLVMCFACHNVYEKHAHDLKLEIAIEYGVPINGSCEKMVFDDSVRRVKKAANTLLVHRDKMPVARIDELTKMLRDFYHKEEVTEEDLKAAGALEYHNLSSDYIHHGKYVVEQTPDLEVFVKRWRKHFIHTMQPKYLPAGWDSDRTILRDKCV